MLPRKTILTTLRTLREPLRKFGVSKIGLFGSCYRNEAGESSDIDILIDFDEDKETYINYINSCETLEKSLRTRSWILLLLRD